MQREIVRLTDELRTVEKEIVLIKKEKRIIDEKLDRLKTLEQDEAEETKIAAAKDTIKNLESKADEIKNRLESLLVSKKINNNKIDQLRQSINLIEQEKTRLPAISEDESNATDFINSIIIKAREAKKSGQKLIIGFDTSWIPGYEKGRLEHMALNPLIRELEKLEAKLADLSLDNVIIVNKSGDDLANELLLKSQTTNTPLSNMVVLASMTVVESKAFDQLRTTAEQDGAFMAAINTDEIDTYCKEHPEESERLYISIIEMMKIALNLSMGVDTPNDPMIILYDKKARMVIFLPKPEPVDFMKLKKRYDIQRQVILNA